MLTGQRDAFDKKYHKNDVREESPGAEDRLERIG